MMNSNNLIFCISIIEKSSCDPVIQMNIATPLKFTDKKAIEASLSRHLWPILGNFIAFPSQLGSLEDHSALGAV